MSISTLKFVNTYIYLILFLSQSVNVFSLGVISLLVIYDLIHVEFVSVFENLLSCSASLMNDWNTLPTVSPIMNRTQRVLAMISFLLALLSTLVFSFVAWQ